MPDTSTLQPQLLILGASTRSAAHSARRAGYRPVFGDLFADADLAAVADVIAVPDYPQGLAAATADWAGVPWMYVGALENHPAEIAAMTEHHELLGNGPDVLQLCRDPWWVAERLQSHALSVLRLRASNNPPPRNGEWMCKPLSGAGGRGVGVWGPGALLPEEACYFQQRIEGRSISGLYLGHAVESTETCRLLGISRQLSCQVELQAPPCGYCGSIAPWPVSQKVESLIREIGSVLQRACGLRGLFGIDFILADDVPYLLEINPRYTASVELWERQLQLPLLTAHIAACREQDPADRLFAGAAERTGESIHDIHGPMNGRYEEAYTGKVILYADREAVAPDLSHLISTAWPEYADLPVAGSPIIPGQPVFTCLGQGADPKQMQRKLIQRAQHLWSTFPAI